MRVVVFLWYIKTSLENAIEQADSDSLAHKFYLLLQVYNRPLFAIGQSRHGFKIETSAESPSKSSF